MLPNNAVNTHSHTDNSYYATASHNLYFAFKIVKNVKMHHFCVFYPVFGGFLTVSRKFCPGFDDMNFGISPNSPKLIAI